MKKNTYVENIPLEKLVILSIEDELLRDEDSRLKNVFSDIRIVDSGGTVFLADNRMHLNGIITVGDYRRYLQTGNLKINKDYKYVLRNKQIFSNIMDIKDKYESIIMIPEVDENGVLLSAFCLKSYKSVMDNSYLNLGLKIAGYPEEIKNYFNGKKLRLHARDASTLCLYGNMFEKILQEDNIYYALYDDEKIFNLMAIYGERVQMYYEVNDEPDFIELFLEPYMVSPTGLNILDLFEFINEITEGKLSAYTKWDVDLELIEQIEKEYGINCKFVQIPTLQHLDRKTKKIKMSDIDEMVKIYMNTQSPSIEQKEDYFKIAEDNKVYKNGMFTFVGGNNFVHYTNGKRFVPDTPEIYKNKVYLIGTCAARGVRADDYHTIGAFLQKKISGRYKVELCSSMSVRANYLKWLGKIRVKNGDYIIFIDSMGILPKCDLDMTERFQKLFDENGQFFFDRPIHCNYLGYECIADAIYEEYFSTFLCDIGDATSNNQSYFIKEFKREINNIYTHNLELEEYKNMLRNNKISVNGKIGAIVMNCNPFTLGHRYLIESALEYVDFLYIFVVEEDKSQFKFKDRLRLVKEGTQDLKNLLVLPSGKFIISADTFPEYFTKGMSDHVFVDASLDVEIFACHIAPVLDITVRFAGEEPLDEVTREYNNNMQEILPDYGIEFKVIPRKELDGEVISATKVRKFIKENEYEKLSKMVPDTTFRYLREKGYI